MLSLLDDLIDVKRAVIELAARWRAIGEALRLTTGKLDSISLVNLCDPEKCLSDVLSEWLCNYPGSRVPSWRWLVEVVADPVGGNNRQLAKQIARQHPASELYV